MSRCVLKSRLSTVFFVSHWHWALRWWWEGKRLSEKNLKNPSSFGEPEVPTLSLTSMQRHPQSASSSSWSWSSTHSGNFLTVVTAWQTFTFLFLGNLKGRLSQLELHYSEKASSEKCGAEHFWQKFKLTGINLCKKWRRYWKIELLHRIPPYPWHLPQAPTEIARFPLFCSKYIFSSKQLLNGTDASIEEIHCFSDVE